MPVSLAILPGQVNQLATGLLGVVLPVMTSQRERFSCLLATDILLEENSKLVKGWMNQQLAMCPGNPDLPVLDIPAVTHDLVLCRRFPFLVTGHPGKDSLAPVPGSQDAAIQDQVVVLQTRRGFFQDTTKTT